MCFELWKGSLRMGVLILNAGPSAGFKLCCVSEKGCTSIACVTGCYASSTGRIATMIETCVATSTINTLY